MATGSLSGATGTASSIAADYMKLLVTQLQNQNPLEPMDNAQMTSQLASLSQLEQLENMSGTFAKVLAAQQFSQAAAMVGREVAIPTEDGDGTEAGTVLQVDFADGEPRLVVRVDRAVVKDNQQTTEPVYRSVGFDEVQSIGAQLSVSSVGSPADGVSGDGETDSADGAGDDTSA